MFLARTALEIFAVQASLAIFGNRRLAELRTKVDSLSSGLERQQRLLSVTQNDLPILLRKDLDQTIAIHKIRALRFGSGSVSDAGSVQSKSTRSRTTQGKAATFGVRRIE